MEINHNIIKIPHTIVNSAISLGNNFCGRLFSRFAAFLFLSALLFSSQAIAQTMSATSNGAQGKSCAKVSCDKVLSSCKPNLNIISSTNKLNAKCLTDSAKDGCFEPIPVGCTKNVTGVGNRPHGAGGNSKPRYHLGNDIGSAGCSNAPGTNYKFINVYAAADGVVMYQSTSGCGGRTIAINHDKGCTGGKNPQYKTIYRHLLQYKVKIGQNVKKGQVIGIMGGSNSAGAGKPPCDNPEQSGAPGYEHTSAACSAAASHCGGASSYAIHMHFEIVDGGLASRGAGTGISGQSLYKPDCDNIQQLCGGCQSNAGSCNNGTQGFSDGSSGDVNGAFEAGGGGEYSDPTVLPTCTYSPYLDSSKCVFCELFKTMFNTASQIALMADAGLMGPTLTLVKIGFLIWLAVYLLKQLASFNATTPGELTKGILFQGFRVAVVALILNSQASLFYVMDLTLNPVMLTGLSFTETLTEGQACDKNADYMQNIMGYSSKDGYASSSNPTGGLSTEVGESLMCNLKRMEDATGLFMTLGKFSVCLSMEPSNKWLNVIPGLGYLTTGIFLWLAGLALLLTFPWCLVDCVLQLCISAALVPCAIGAFAFKITSKYLKIVWNFFINAMFNFVFMALIIYIINTQLQSWIGYKLTDEEPPHEIFIQFGGLAWYGMGFIRVAAICFFCYVFFDEAKTMAEKFADSPGLGGGKGIGRMVGGTVAGAAGQAGAAGFHLGIKGAKTIGAGANAVVGNSFRSARNHFVGYAASRLGKNGVVTAADGKAIGHTGSFRLLGRDIKFSATQGEDGKWSLTREVHKRSQSDKAFEKVFDKDGNELKDENGNTVYRHRRRLFGITRGYEDMTATRDKDGNLVYSTANGKTQFRMGEDDQISSYTTGFTRSYLGFGKIREKQNIKQYGTNRTVNTATSRTRESIDSQGNVTGSEIEMQDFNLFNRDLVRKDGTINIDTFNEMQNSIGDSKRAAQALVAQVMEKRGMKLDNKYAQRTVDIDDEGRVTIHQTQKDKDGKIVNTQNIQAVMIGDQMFIANEIIDKDGNSTLNESNGIFRTVQTATRDKDGKYSYNFDGGFSEYTLSKNNHIPPLNHNGRWGNGVDRDKAMAGFTQSHYDKYMAKLNIKQLHRTEDAATYRNSEQVQRLNGMIHAQKLDSMEEAKQNMTYVKENAKGEKTYTFDDSKGNDSNDNKTPEVERGEVKNSLDEIQEIHQEMEKENAERERLEKEQRELKEKEDTTEEQEERIKHVNFRKNQKKFRNLESVRKNREFREKKMKNKFENDVNFTEENK